MDDERRNTLRLIERAVRFATPEERGRQLILVVRDYVEDSDMAEAVRVLRLVEQSYLDRGLLAHANDSRDFGAAVALLIETLGLDFTVLARPTAKA